MIVLAHVIFSAPAVAILDFFFLVSVSVQYQPRSIYTGMRSIIHPFKITVREIKGRYEEIEQSELT